MKEKKIIYIFFVLIILLVCLSFFIFRKNRDGVLDKNSVTLDENTITSTPQKNLWAYSDKRNITLQQPTTNSSIKSNDVISGLANGIKNITFVLRDNKNGVIDQGYIPVNNGRFSGYLTFKKHGNVGTLQVYYPNPSDGSEQDPIIIDVNYAD